jgi:hypothetical protein
MLLRTLLRATVYVLTNLLNPLVQVVNKTGLQNNNVEEHKLATRQRPRNKGLALQVLGVSDETVKYGYWFCETRIIE